MNLTLLQIDFQNLSIEAKKKGHLLDFEKIWEYFNSRENEYLVAGFIYFTKGEDFENIKLEKKMRAIGYQVKTKNLPKITKAKKHIYKRAKHDINIAIDSIDRIDSYTKLILMSGDGDFLDLCKYLREKRNKQIEIWSFKESYNPILDVCADKIYFLNDDFFYNKPNIEVFGLNRSLS